MLNPEPLYDFGISQDDPATELRFLDFNPGDRVLCVASAGEVPLELLVNVEQSLEIDAVDISQSQLYLTNLKLQATKELKGIEAARFLGYLPTDSSRRVKWFDQIKQSLSQHEVQFWLGNTTIFEKGPIQYGRYEKYILHFSPLGRWLLGGRKKLMKLFDCANVEQQKAYFDDILYTKLLKILFKLMFHRRLYSNRGISEQGLIHMNKENAGARFFQKFRGFCTNTPARKNWYLQFMLFGRVLFEDALPVYLQPEGQERVRAVSGRLRLINKPYIDMIEESPQGYYNKFILSNISDWLMETDMIYLMDHIARKAASNATGVMRYIHSSGITPQALHKRVILDTEKGQQLLQSDRFPFYNLIPFKISGSADEK